MNADAVLTELFAEAPTLHRGGSERWDVSRGTLRLLADLVKPGHATLEVGVGVSTIMFAALGSAHRAISPAPAEFVAVRQWCADHGIDTDRLQLLTGLSDCVLPDLKGAVDLALIDGAHAFPIPIVDFHFVRRLVRVGGVLVLDDLPIPSMAEVYRFLSTEPTWARVALVDNRAAAFRRLAADPAGDPWGDQAYNRTYPDYSFLPPLTRYMVASEAYVKHSSAVRGLRSRVAPLDRLARRLGQDR